MINYLDGINNEEDAESEVEKYVDEINKILVEEVSGESEDSDGSETETPISAIPTPPPLPTQEVKGVENTESSEESNSPRVGLLEEIRNRPELKSITGKKDTQLAATTDRFNNADLVAAKGKLRKVKKVEEIQGEAVTTNQQENKIALARGLAARRIALRENDAEGERKNGDDEEVDEWDDQQ